MQIYASQELINLLIDHLEMFHLLPTKFHPNRYKIDRIKEGG